MNYHKRFQALVCLGFLAIVIGGSYSMAAAPVDHPCIVDPLFPSDCAEQLGPIGGTPAESEMEGYLGIASPVIDPLLRLETDDFRNGRLYALNPGNNTIRVLSADAGQVLADIEGCYRPSALAADATGSRVFVSCYASNAVGIIDTELNLLIAMIQDRDSLGRPLMQEPMGLAFVNDLLYVASSQNDRVAVIDLQTQAVLRYIQIPGADPRALTVTDDAAYLIVANMQAGNRTEPVPTFNTPLTEACEELLEDPTARDVFDEQSPEFMNDEHPQYAEIAECYFAHTLGSTHEEIKINPLRPDHDLVVVRLSDEQIVFTTDTLSVDPGALNYGVTTAGDRVYLTTVQALNQLRIRNRPLINRLAIFDIDSSSGALTPVQNGIVDLDDPFLNPFGFGNSEAATPYAVAVAGDQLLVTAAGSDRLLMLDADGALIQSIPVGFAPKGLVVDGNVAWVYNATGMSISRVDLDQATSVEVAGIGPSPIPDTVRLGARLFESAEFASNRTFACASCHPDGHLDGLVWKLNEADGLRATMSVRQISELEAYHWDASKCNLLKIIQDGVVNLFDSPAPSECESKAMIDYMNHLVHPRTPFRPLDDSLTSEAAVGAAVVHRSQFLDSALEPQTCNETIADVTVQGMLLEVAGDPRNTVASPMQGCGQSSCHVAPHMGTREFRDGEIAASTLLGLWDRNVITSDSSPTRAKVVQAIETNRVFYGAPPVQDGAALGELDVLGFVSLRFRKKELNLDNDPATRGFALSDAAGRFMVEEQQIQSGAVGLSVALRTGVGDELTLVDHLESAADQGKIVLGGIGLLGGQLQRLTWEAADQHYLSDLGIELTRAELLAALQPGDAMVLTGRLLPGQESALRPKLTGVRRADSPYLCTEDYADYPAAVKIGESGALIQLAGIDVAPGTRVLIDGHVTGEPLAGAGPVFEWALPAAPSNSTLLAVQLLGPSGLLSNTLPLPIVNPVVPPAEISGLLLNRSVATTRIAWDSQFGVTGPGTRYAVHRGDIAELHATGQYNGICLNTLAAGDPIAQDRQIPAPHEAFYYLVRAENQLGASSWGAATRDASIDSCGSGLR